MSVSIILAFLKKLRETFVELPSLLVVAQGDGFLFRDDGFGFAAGFEEDDGFGVKEFVVMLFARGFGGGDDFLGEGEIAFAIAQVTSDADGETAE